MRLCTPENLTSGWNWSTITKCIAWEANCTSAGWGMIYNSAFGVRSAASRAWINTFLIDACSVWRTVWVENAFWSTVWRCANHVWLASALGLSWHDLTLRIGPTRRGIAGIRRNRSQSAFFYDRSRYSRYKNSQTHMVTWRIFWSPSTKWPTLMTVNNSYSGLRDTQLVDLQSIP